MKRLEEEEAAENGRQGALEEEEEQQDETGDEFVIKSLEDIQREKALQSMKQNRLKKEKKVVAVDSEPTTVPASKPKRDRAEPRQPGGKKRVLTTRRTGKQEIQIYKPPGAKLKGRH